MASITLCSFTYNDAPLLHRLLAGVAAWPTQPDEIVLVDDGSAEPFSLTPAEQKLPVRLLRLPKNQGFTKAKHAGLSAATGDVIVSLDCDVELEGDFLGNAVKMLAEPGVGLVGPQECGTMNKDLLSAYLNSLAEAPGMSENREASFINGPALAISRELWHAVGGYAGHSGPAAAHDYYLCALLQRRGYRMLIDKDSRVRSTRVLTRHAFVRRVWQWCAHSWLDEIKPSDTLPDYARAMLLQGRARCVRAIDEGNPTWVYFELLQLIHIYFEFCAALGGQGLLPVDAAQKLLGLLSEKLAPYPLLLRLLRADLTRLGNLPLKEQSPPGKENKSPLAAACEWSLLAALLDEFAENLILEYLMKVGVKEILDDEAKLQSDFSSY